MAQTRVNCEHHHNLNNGIHKLVILSASKEAVDEALAHLVDILQAHPKAKTLYLLIDARKAIPPLQYLFGSLRRLYSRYDSVPAIRAAYIYEKSLVLSMLRVFFNAIPIRASRHFIQGGTEEEAEAWLLSGEK